jgi:hypothetical protein
VNDSPHLQPGDTVIAVGYLSMMSSLVTGAITVGMLLHHVGASWPRISGGVIMGAIGGAGSGSMFARTFFPARPGHMFVVRRESSALPLTLRATLIPCLVTALCAATVMAQMDLSPWGTGLVIGTVIAVLVGSAMGSASALVK